ncbi:MAG: hypothetical protein H6555_08935 [Lewinellaceae bacterium]|nr:hypothetical protein [Lewinellaceae bacterium]
MRLLSWIMAVYFFVGSCFPGADFSQLPKVANLNAHFQMHRDLALLKGENLSFGRFLSIHFFKPQRHSDQHRPQDHHELPLQSVHSSVLDQCPTQLLELTALLTHIETDAPSFHFLHIYSSEYTGSIFQPPIYA